MTTETSFLLKSPFPKRGGTDLEAIFCYNLEVSGRCQVNPVTDRRRRRQAQILLDIELSFGCS
jgi:hypothetical protein